MSERDKAVFLSYASQDAEAVRRIAEALRAAGVEVWFDQNELVGGDAWDAKIRKQIAECALFVPVISANTNARGEGYFRLEWKLAVDRSHLMAHDQPFLLPVVIDDTTDAAARVPPEFRAVQWTRLPGGETREKFRERVRALLGGGALLPPAPEASERGLKPRATPDVGRRVPVAAWLAIVAVMAGAAGYFAFRPGPKSDAPTRPPAPEKSSATASPARQLAAQAEALLADEFNSTRENYQLAEELCRKALAADGADAEIWALAARISFDQIFRSYDMSDHRRELGREQAQRAFKLAPDSISAGLAVATDQRQRGNIDEAVRLQRGLMGRDPTNRGVLRLGAELARLRRDDAAVADHLARLQALTGGDPLSLFTEAHHLINVGRYPEAGALLDRVIAKNPGLLPCYEKFYLLVRGWADYEAARKFLAQIPAQFLDEDSFVALAARMWILNGDGDAALKALQRVPREFLEEFGNSEPKGYAAGWAQTIAGRSAAATLEWRQALAQVEARLAADGKNLDLLQRKALLQASLGQKADAQATLRLGVELGGERAWSRGIWRINVLALTGETEAAIALLESQWPALDFHLRSYLRGDLAHEPQLAAIRGDPRVQRLVAEHTAALEKLKGSPGPLPARAGEAAPPDDKSVAVLAFANLSDDKANEYFSDGISEELLNVLAKVPGLKVSARTSAFSFKGKNVPMPEIGKQLGVAYVVEGSVRKAGDKVRITAQLIKAADGFRVWSENFNRDLKDVFAVQDEIARIVSENLSMQLGVSSPPKARSVSPEAYQLYLQARQAWNLRTLDGFTLAEELLGRVIAQEPRFAPAHAALSDVWALSFVRMDDGGSFAKRDSPILARAIAKAEEAIALDASCAEAYAALGSVLGMAWRPREALRALRRAVEVNPNYATAHQWLGRRLSEMGDLPGARAAHQRAAELDPLSHRILDNASDPEVLVGNFAGAMSLLQRAAQLNPGSVQVRCKIVFLLWTMGRREEAIAAARALAAETETEEASYRHSIAAMVLGSTGHAAEAERLLARMVPHGDDHLTAIAYLGRTEEFVAQVEKLKVDGLHWFLFDPRLAAVRAAPVFQAWMARIDRADVLTQANAWRAANPVRMQGPER